MCRRAFRPITHDAPWQTIALVPQEVSQRMMVQQSMFTVHDDHIPLEQLAEEGTFLCRFDIPAVSKMELAKQLERVGVRLSTLFPDLDQLATDLNTSKQLSGSLPLSMGADE